MSNNTIALVKQVIDELEAARINVLLGGGWAEELSGMWQKEPGHHGDIDLHYVAENFTKIDTFVKSNGLTLSKHMPHKRAFKYHEVLVEVILIQEDSKGYFSHYNQGLEKSKVIRWPDNLKTVCDGLHCLSVEALKFKRGIHRELFPATN